MGIYVSMLVKSLFVLGFYFPSDTHIYIYTWDQIAWIQIPALFLTTHVILTNLLSLFFLFPHV